MAEEAVKGVEADKMMMEPLYVTVEDVIEGMGHKEDMDIQVLKGMMDMMECITFKYILRHLNIVLNLQSNISLQFSLMMTFLNLEKLYLNRLQICNFGKMPSHLQQIKAFVQRNDYILFNPTDAPAIPTELQINYSGEVHPIKFSLSHYVPLIQNEIFCKNVEIRPFLHFTRLNKETRVLAERNIRVEFPVNNGKVFAEGA